MMLLAHILGIPVEESLMPLASGVTAGTLLVLAGMMRKLLASHSRTPLQPK